MARPGDNAKDPIAILQVEIRPVLTEYKVKGLDKPVRVPSLRDIRLEYFNHYSRILGSGTIPRTCDATNLLTAGIEDGVQMQQTWGRLRQ